MLIEVKECTDFLYTPDSITEYTRKHAASVLKQQNRLRISLAGFNGLERRYFLDYLLGVVCAGGGSVTKCTSDTFLFIYAEPFWKRFFRNN